MSRCSRCGVDVPTGAQVCPSCGARADGVTASLAPVESAQFGVPAQPAVGEGPMFVVVKGPEIGERFMVDRPELTIGRGPDSDIFLNDVTVSRHHARVLMDAGGVKVQDAESLNGTYVNGEVCSEAVLADGDHLQIGRFQMVFFTGERP